jgi:hypothetical protein
VSPSGACSPIGSGTSVRSPLAELSRSVSLFSSHHGTSTAAKGAPGSTSPGVLGPTSFDALRGSFLSRAPSLMEEPVGAAVGEKRSAGAGVSDPKKARSMFETSPKRRPRACFVAQPSGHSNEGRSMHSRQASNGPASGSGGERPATGATAFSASMIGGKNDAPVGSSGKTNLAGGAPAVGKIPRPANKGSLHTRMSAMVSS